MPYSGVISENHFKLNNQKRTTLPYVKFWMKELEEKVLSAQIPLGSTYYLISLKGFFKDERCPDLSNLHTVIANSIKKGLFVDDKYFRFQDLGYKTGFNEPYLEITIEGKDN